MTTRFLTSAAALAFAAALATPVPASAAEAAGANAKVAITAAIATAEAKGAGKATEAEFDDDNGGRWEVKILADAGNKLTTYFVDPNSGEVTGQEEQTYEKYFTMLKPEDFAKAQTQLKDAIAAAEALAKGKAIGAEVERKGDSVAYEIDVATTAGKRDVKVDAMGKAVAD